MVKVKLNDIILYLCQRYYGIPIIKCGKIYYIYSSFFKY